MRLPDLARVRTILSHPDDRSRRVAAALTALLWWLAGACAQCCWLGWLALAPLGWLLLGLPAKSRVAWGYATGFLAFWLINWWLVPTITFGAPAIGAPPPIGFALGLVAVTLIALIHATTVAAIAWLWRGPRSLPLVALAWYLLDWMRCQGPLAHSWGALAFTQVPDLPVLQCVGLVGQHGLSALCAGAGMSLGLWLRNGDRRCLWGPVALLGMLHAYGVYRLALPERPGRTLRVLLVQTEINSLRKKGLVDGESPLDQATRLTASAAGDPYDLAVWPETTADVIKIGPGRYNGLDWFEMRQVPRVLLAGAGADAIDGRCTNEAIYLAPGEPVQSRAKSRLVPFGERAPFSEIFPWLNGLARQPPLEPGDGSSLLRLDGLRGGSVTAAVQICFESCFPDRETGSGQVLFVITNDDWFSGTEAPAQHRNMAILRAVENNVPVVQVANGGYSFAANARGQVLESLPYGVPCARSAVVPLTSNAPTAVAN